MLIVIMRTTILYLSVIIVIRLMGKRQVGELQPFELAITIMISALAAFPMEDIDIPLLYSLIPIFLMLSFQVIISQLSLKNTWARSFICGRPTILIKNGELEEKELKKLRLSLTDLFEQLRMKGYYSLEEIEFVIMETTGEISVIPNSNKRNIRTEDLELNVPQEKIPIPLIIDGKIEKKNLREIKKNKNWLENKLAKDNLKAKDVFYAALDTSHNFIYQAKKKEKS